MIEPRMNAEGRETAVGRDRRARRNVLKSETLFLARAFDRPGGPALPFGDLPIRKRCFCWTEI
jgi:hypothetical protein